MIFGVISFAFDVIGAFIPAGGAVMGMVNTAANALKDSAMRLSNLRAKNAKTTDNSLDSMIARAHEEMKVNLEAGIENMCHATTVFSKSPEAVKVRQRIAKEKGDAVAQIIMERAASELFSIYVFGKDWPQEIPEKWKITTMLERITKKDVREAVEKQAKAKQNGRICARKFNKISQYDGTHTELLTAAGFGVDVATTVLGKKKLVDHVIEETGKEVLTKLGDKMKKLGDTMAGFGLAVAAFELFKTFDYGYCPLDLLPQSCQDVGDHLCGDGVCEPGCCPERKWLCRCNDGTLATYCPMTTESLAAQKVTSKTKLNDEGSLSEDMWKNKR